MTVNIDPSAGFCWGVVRAVDIAEENLNSGKLYSLGDIIHNTAEIRRLNEKGLDTVSVDDFEKLPAGSRVLVRAHGEPPSTYKKAEQYGIQIIDATCPVVAKVQERIKKFYDSDYQVVIFGKKDHAEVIGLKGVTDENAVVIKSVEEALEKVDLSRPTVLFSQTTMDRETFAQITGVLKEKIADLQVQSASETAVEFLAKNTICGQVSGREKKLREFARNNDVIIFAAGKKSSNGKVLYNIAKEENSRIYFVEDESEVDASWLEGAESVGITGATSTPQWLMQKIKETVLNLELKTEN